MPRRIEEEIQENRRTARRLNSYFREPATEQATALAFAPVELVASVEATVSTRPLNDTLVVGAAGAGQAVGRGRIGDHRGSWSQVASTSTGRVVEGGHQAIAETLAGIATGFEHVAVGRNGGSTAENATALEDERRIVDAWGTSTTSDSTTGVGVLRVTDLVDVVEELGLYDQDERLLARLTAVGVDPAVDEEVKVEIDVTLSPSTTSSAAVTDLDTVTDLLATEATTGGIKWLALGTDGTAPTQSDTSLGAEEVRKEVSHDVVGGRLVVGTEVFRDEPSDQPHDLEELGAIADDGTLVWRRTFGTEQKDDRVRLEVRDGLTSR